MKRLVKSLPFDLTYLGVLGYGLFRGAAWATNIGLFVSWFIALVLGGYILVDREDFNRRVREKGLRSKVFIVWDSLTDLGAVMMLAATAHFIIATLLAIACLLKHNLYLETEKAMRKENAHETPKARPQDSPTQAA